MLRAFFMYGLDQLPQLEQLEADGLAQLEADGLAQLEADGLAQLEAVTVNVKYHAGFSA